MIQHYVENNRKLSLALTRKAYSILSQRYRKIEIIIKGARKPVLERAKVLAEKYFDSVKVKGEGELRRRTLILSDDYILYRDRKEYKQDRG